MARKPSAWRHTDAEDQAHRAVNPGRREDREVLRRDVRHEGSRQGGRSRDARLFLTDGDINLAILNFKNDTAAGSERGKNFAGIHHIGFQVDSLEAIAERLTAAGSRRRHDVEQALGVKPDTEGNVEVKWTGPDGVMLDVSKTGWLGTPTFGH